LQPEISLNESNLDFKKHRVAGAANYELIDRQSLIHNFQNILLFCLGALIGYITLHGVYIKVGSLQEYFGYL